LSAAWLGINHLRWGFFSAKPKQPTVMTKKYRIGPIHTTRSFCEKWKSVENAEQKFEDINEA
jgi:hypothetical protein